MDLHWLGEKGHGHWWLDALQTHRWSGGGNREASPLDHMPSLPGATRTQTRWRNYIHLHTKPEPWVRRFQSLVRQWRVSPQETSGEIRFPGCSGQESLEPRQQLQENVPPLEREEVWSGDAGPCVQRGSHVAPPLKPPQGWKCPVRRCFSSSSFPPLALLSLSGAGLLARGLAHSCGPVGWGEFTSASVQAACFPTAGCPCGLSDGVPHPPGPPHSLPVGNKTRSFRLSVKPGGALSISAGFCVSFCVFFS